MTSLETLEGLYQARPGGLVFAAYAESLDRAGRREDAEKVLTDGIVRWPRHLAGRIVQGRLARERGDWSTAREAFQAAVEIDANSRAALHGLADACTRQQYLKQAFESWNRLAILDPDNTEAADAARSVASRLDSNGAATGLVPVREQEDTFSRDALLEGTTALPASASHAVEHMGDLSFGSPTAAVPLAADLPGFGAPDLSFSPPALDAAAFAPPDTTSTPFAKFEESGLATLELPSFPGKTIPPPPMEAQKPALAAPFGFGDEGMGLAEATQLMPAPKAGAPVTGDDIEDRLDEVFGATSQPMPPSLLPISTEPGLSGMIAPAGSEIQPHTVTGGDIENRLDEVFGASSEPEPGLLSAPTAASIVPPPPRSEPLPGDRVTGDDVENRLDEVFGSSSVHLPAFDSPPPSGATPVASPASAMDPSSPVTGEDVGNRLGELFGETGEMPLMAPPAPVSEEAPEATVPDLPVVSGKDIAGRLDDLFGESVIDLTSPADSFTGVASLEAEVGADPGADTSLMDKAALGAEDTPRPGASTTSFRTEDLPRSAVEESAKPVEIDPAGSTIDLPTVDYGGGESQLETSLRLTGDDVDSRLDELFASSEFLAEPPLSPTSAKTGFVARPVSTDPGVVTGEDIEGRLDDLFGTDSDFPVSLPTVTFAEEYLRQGHKEKAVSIYRQLLDRDPGNAELRRRLDEIEGRS